MSGKIFITNKLHLLLLESETLLNDLLAIGFEENINNKYHDSILNIMEFIGETRNNVIYDECNKSSDKDITVI